MSLQIIGILTLLCAIAVSVAVLVIKKNMKLSKKIKDQQDAIDEAEKAVVKAREYMKVHVFADEIKDDTEKEIKNAETIDDIRSSFDTGLDRLRELRGDQEDNT